MPTRNVVLSDHQQDFIENLVQSGRYQNASEVLRDGLRLVEQRERIEEAKLAALQQAATAGFAALDAGQFVELRDDQLEDFIEQLGRNATRRVKASA